MVITTQGVGRKAVSISGFGATGRMNLDFLPPVPQNALEKELTMRAQEIKRLENLAQKVHDFGEGKILLKRDTRRAVVERVTGLH